MPKFNVYTYNGKEYRLSELAQFAGVSTNTLYSRIHRIGLTVEDAVKGFVPPRGMKAKRYSCKGYHLTLREWSRLTGIAYQTLYVRLQAGWTVEQALSIPTDALRRRGVVRPLDHLSGLAVPSTDHQTPGVPSDLGPFVGTGAGSTALEISNITFREKAEA